MARKLYASWAHGCAGVSEDSKVTVLRQGFGATFNIPTPPFGPNGAPRATTHYIHIPIATPVIMGDSGRLKVLEVLYLYNAVNGVRLEGLYVYDGHHLVLGNDGISATGDHTDKPRRFTAPENNGIGHIMSYGLGLTFRLRSPFSDEEQQGQFFLAGAGADFVTQ